MDDCLGDDLPLVYSDESDEEECPPSIEPTPSIELESQPKESVVSKSTESADNADMRSSDDDDDDIVNRSFSIKKTKKSKQIFSSDEEEEEHNDGNDGEKQPSEIGSDEDAQVEDKPKPRPAIWDSDTKSSSKEEDSGAETKKTKKKVKRKVLKKKASKSGSGSNASSGESDDDEKATKRKTSVDSKNSSSQSGSSDSNQSANDEPPKPREKHNQRMSAKVAEDQIKEIQSESQRLAREAFISVPYHKPKQYSLKEFLSRRSIVQHQQEIKSKPVQKAAAAIKMSAEELMLFAEKLEKRTQEAEEFFQNEDEQELKPMDCEDNEDSDEQPAIDTPATIEENKVADKADIAEELNTDDAYSEPPKLNNEIAPVDEQVEVNEPNEELNLQNDFDGPIELHSVQTDLDIELDNMIKLDNRPKRDLSSIPLGPVPKLKGGSGMIIDLETNEIKPKEKSGIDELVERFVKNAVKKTAPENDSRLGIFNTETGSVEQHKVQFISDDANLKKDPRPGEAFFKWKSTLGKKIEEKRRELVAKRLEEEKQKRMEMESDEEEFEEYSDCESSKKDVADCDEGPVYDDEENEECEAEPVGSLIYDEASDQEDARGSDSESESTEEDGDEIDDKNTNDKPPQRRRIIAAFENDSDEESKIETTNAQTESEPPVTNSMATPSIEPTQEANVSLLNNSSIKLFNSDDLFASQSEIVQLNESIDKTPEKKTETSTLFDCIHNDDTEIGESQLMELCSGSFATQNVAKPDEVATTVEGKIETPPDSENMKSKLETLLSSDDEEGTANEQKSKKLKKKGKKKQHKKLDYSDDEEEIEKEPSDDSDESELGEEEENENTDEEDPGEKYVEYDSDENEVEVKMKKKDVRKKASEYFENEAELSESEWGSADEDEKDLDTFEAELGDDDEFDKEKLHSELERIRLREQIDQDAREIRILKEHLIEEEDNGQERERKFRWKHLNNAEDGDQSLRVDQETNETQESDDENEEAWRRLRYEREQLLQQQINDSMANEKILTESTEENVSFGTKATAIISSFRRSLIAKQAINSPKIASPFLINRSELNVGHLSRKSFLNRDTSTLEKLFNSTKSASDGDTILNTAKAKGNYVFVATEKKNDLKRKSDTGTTEALSAGASASKKSKLDETKNNDMRPQTKRFFDLLS